MALTYIDVQPGFNNDSTNYAAKNAWYTGDRVRFKDGLPQSLGGWSDTGLVVSGRARHMVSWVDLQNNVLTGVGTNLKYYVISNNALTDITPTYSTVLTGLNFIAAPGGGNNQVVIRLTNSAGTVQLPFVPDTFRTGDAVSISGMTQSVGDYTPAQINVTGVGTRVSGDTSSILITLPTASISSGALFASSGLNLTLRFAVPQGGVDAIPAGVFGAGSYGYGPWGGTTDVTTPGFGLRIWSASNFGQDLVLNYRGGQIYYWNRTTGGTAQTLDTLPYADSPPSIANFIMVSPADQRVLAFGCNPYGTTTLDPLQIRWSTDGSAANWHPSTSNTSGDLRLSSGSQIYCAHISKGQILVWTESSLHTMTFVGGDLIYGSQIISSNVDIVGPNAACVITDFAMWMGRENFYIYDGTIRTMPCTVRQYVFSDINLAQSFKVYASTNAAHREVWFFYPSASSTENNRYVIYNYAENLWYYGNMDRTAWIDRGLSLFPQAVDTNGKIYFHEKGLNDGSTSPASPLNSYIQSGPLEIGVGDRFSFVNRLIPDITFTGSMANSPSVLCVVRGKNYPGSTYNPDDQVGVTKISSFNIEQFTTKQDLRVRGRSVDFKIACSGTDVAWRAGRQRLDVRPDGAR